ncbi:MAG: polyphenol oxidase family protein [Bdellovibrionota bacterium]
MTKNSAIFEASQAAFIEFQALEWKKNNISHGFCGKNLCPVRKDLSESVELLCKTKGLSAVVIPVQEHTNQVSVFSVEELLRINQLSLSKLIRPTGASDSVIITNHDLIPNNFAAGVITADCVPILIHAKSSLAAIHAGWRGLASGIISETISRLLFSDSSELSILVGPCAGLKRYEVGEEVIVALGENAVFESSANPGKYLLDLAATAERLLKAAAPNAILSSCYICTISETSFASYRRDQALIASNISYVSF